MGSWSWDTCLREKVNKSIKDPKGIKSKLANNTDPFRINFRMTKAPKAWHTPTLNVVGLVLILLVHRDAVPPGNTLLAPSGEPFLDECSHWMRMRYLHRLAGL